jgi:type II secretory pathway pseudopilin PulG
MKKLSPKGTARAFTLIEVLVIVITVIMIAAFLIPGLVRERRRARVVYCSDNLKQVGLAFRTWIIDSGSEYVTHVRMADGGTKELVGTGQVFIHFRVMSNELSTPKVLVCPLDKAKVVATNFAVGFSDKNVSYSVGTDAMETYPQTLLSGDRNLAFQGQPIKPGLFVLTTNNTSLTWTKALHYPCGNVGLGDGSVQFWDVKQLAAGVQNQGMDTNLLVFP